MDGSQLEVSVEPVPDSALDEVEAMLRGIRGYKPRIREAIGRAIDEVVDPVRSERWRMDQLDQPEKTVFGIRAENVLRSELGLSRASHLDVVIAGHNVDIKFTMRSNWAIPPEAVGEVCLLTSCTDAIVVSAGLLRTDERVLNPRGNRDRKRGVSAAGKLQIRWLVRDEPAEESVVGFIAAMDGELRAAVTDTGVGAQERLNRLFLEFQNKPLPETVPRAVSLGHVDWTRRMRPDRSNPNAPETEGYEVLRSTSWRDRQRLNRHGFPDLQKGYCMSVALGGVGL